MPNNVLELTRLSRLELRVVFGFADGLPAKTLLQTRLTAQHCSSADVTANLSHSGIFMNQNTSQAAQAIIGAWRLISFEIERDDGTVIRPFGADAQGSIIYTDSGRFSAQVMRRGRPSFAAGDQMRGTPEEIEASYKGCISYYGSYKLDADGGFVVHQVEGSLFPNWEGEGQKRFFEFSGDRLKLSTPPTLWGGGGQVVGVLVWERIE
jgi:hypothetical protein